MPNRCLTERATALANAVSKERHQNLLIAIQQLRSEMNSRGVLISSMHVNEVYKACASEQREVAKLIWENMKRAHESCGSKISEDLSALFRALLLNERTKLEQVQEEAVGGIARQLQNQTLVQSHWVSETYDDLMTQYEAEIAIYISNLKQGVGSNLADRLRSRFMNNKFIAVGAVVVAAILVLAGFTDALGKLSSFIRGALGSG